MEPDRRYPVGARRALAARPGPHRPRVAFCHGAHTRSVRPAIDPPPGHRDAMSESFARSPRRFAVAVTLTAPAVCNEHQVRAAAGLTMVAGAVAFSYAYFDKVYVPLQVVATFFFLEFALRVALGIDRSPTGVAGRLLTRRYPPEWVSAQPKRFAWTLGLALSGAMTVITNSGIRGTLPRTICLLCLTLM